MNYIQIISVFAIVFFVASMQQKKKKDLLICQIIANALYSLQYFLLHAYTASFMNLLSVARGSILYENKKKKNSIWVLISFIVLIMIVACFYIKAPIDAIPIIITLLYTFSTWQSKRIVLLYLHILAAALWIYYNINVGAYVSLIGNGFEIVSGIIGIYKLKKRK